MPTEQQEMQKLELLKKYKDLLDASIITEEEFNEKKKELLATKLDSQPNSSNTQNNNSGNRTTTDNTSNAKFTRQTSSTEDLLRYLNNQQKGTSQQQPQYQQQHQQQQTPKEESKSQTPMQGTGAYGMKWYNFIVKFALFAAFALNAINGISFFFGLQYGSNGSLIYNVYPNLRLLDIFYGLSMIALSIMCLITRQALYCYKKKGPTLLLTLQLLNVVISIAYLSIFSSILETSIKEINSQSNLSISIIGTIILAIICHFYFKKRKDMFTY